MKIQLGTTSLQSALLSSVILTNNVFNTVASKASCGAGATGTIYNVGVGKPYASIGDVPLNTLQPGDHICIYPGTYREKFVINRSGTASSPIVFQGVPDAEGNLPVIDGDGAITPLYLDYWNENRNLIKIGGASSPTPTGGGPPEYIRIQNLRLQNARSESGITFTSDRGSANQSYQTNAACIMIEQGWNIDIVGNEITGCGNGIFISSGNSGNVEVTSNYIWRNGHTNSNFEHNVYTETNGITYKYNRFGPLCSTCQGNNLKDRSAGLTVAYNFIEGGNRQLDIVDSPTYNSLPNYDDTLVFGNILIENNDGNRQMVHYGGDSGNESIYRLGTIHFYHNTLLSVRSGRTTLVRLESEQCTMDARNNIIYITDTSSQLELLSEKRGTLFLTNNWFRLDNTVNWVSGIGSGSVTEVRSIFESSTGSIFASPDFDAPPYDLHLGASLLFGTSLAAGVTPVDQEYMLHLMAAARSSADLGAFGYGQIASPTNEPTNSPTKQPTLNPTGQPTPSPTNQPVTSQPTARPTSSSSCIFDNTWRTTIRNNTREKGCDWVAKKPNKNRCKKRGINGDERKASEACSAVCDANCPSTISVFN